MSIFLENILTGYQFCDIFLFVKQIIMEYTIVYKRYFFTFPFNLFFIKKNKVMRQKKRKKSWLQNQVAKVKVLAWYWKMVFSIVIIFIGGSFGMQLFTTPDDFIMVLGFILLSVVLWLLFQMWLPATEE